MFVLWLPGYQAEEFFVCVRSHQDILLLVDKDMPPGTCQSILEAGPGQSSVSLYPGCCVCVRVCLCVPVRVPVCVCVCVVVILATF